MEVDCSLDEFAQALAANGYINDDSCFGEGDLPSVLSVLDSPESFPGSPCSDDDISKVLKLAQFPSPSPNILQTCLPDNFLVKQPKNRDFCGRINSSDRGSLKSFTNQLQTQSSNTLKGLPVASRDPCISNSIIEPINDNLSLTLHNGLLNAHRELRLDQSLIDDGGHFSLDGLQSHDGINNNCVLLESPVSPLPPVNVDGFNFLTAPTLPEYNACGASSSVVEDTSKAANNVGCDSDDKSSVPSKQQKRKRRSRGYSKPSRSRRKKAKTDSEHSSQTTKTPSKQKTKPRLKSQVSCQTSAKIPKDTKKKKDGGNIHSEDSGFESSDKDRIVEADCSATSPSNSEDTSHQHAQTPSADDTEPAPSVEAPDEVRSLRRSSRRTRNTENYNTLVTSVPASSVTVKRVKTEKPLKEPKQSKIDKNKPAPLSKYRRRTANARERDRMKEINEAFDNLKAALPNLERDDGKNKITKFTVLKLAMNYIAALQDMLDYGETEPPTGFNATGVSCFNDSAASPGDTSCSSYEFDPPSDSITSPDKEPSESELSNVKPFAIQPTVQPSLLQAKVHQSLQSTIQPSPLQSTIQPSPNKPTILPPTLQQNVQSSLPPTIQPSTLQTNLQISLQSIIQPSAIQSNMQTSHFQQNKQPPGCQTNKHPSTLQAKIRPSSLNTSNFKSSNMKQTFTHPPPSKLENRHVRSSTTPHVLSPPQNLLHRIIPNVQAHARHSNVQSSGGQSYVSQARIKPPSGQLSTISPPDYHLCQSAISPPDHPPPDYHQSHMTLSLDTPPPEYQLHKSAIISDFQLHDNALVTSPDYHLQHNTSDCPPAMSINPCTSIHSTDASISLTEPLFRSFSVPSSIPPLTVNLDGPLTKHFATVM